MRLMALIFDWDQTLLDSWGVHCDAIWYAATILGLDSPPEEMIRDTYAGTLDEQLETLFGHNDGLLETYRRYYWEHHLVDTHLFPGVQQVIVALMAQRYRLGLLSNKRRHMAVPELEYVGLEECFEAMVFRDDLGVMKPDPQGLQAVLEMLGICPGSALYIGDGPVDVQVARRAGTYSAAALWGTVDKAVVLAEAPDCVWYRPEEALAFLGS